MSYRYVLMLLGAALIGLGWCERGWWWAMVWLGCDFLVLGIAHSLGAPRVFGKRPNGTLAWWSWLSFLPLLVLTTGVWHLQRILSRERPWNMVSDRFAVGRRLLSRECEGEFANVIDLTSEFSEPRALRRLPGYRCFPILDGGAPAPEALRAVVASLRPGRTFIHCAQGHGRTGLFALAVLLHLGVAGSVEEGLRILTAARPAIRLNREQLRCIRSYAQKRS